MPLIIGAKSASAATGVANSCRFNGGDSPYFASDFSGTGSSSAAIATYSFWVKLSLEDDRATLISGKDDTSNYMKIRFADDGAGWYFGLYGVSPACDLKSTPIFQDPSAWYNVVMAFDTAQATDTNRIKVWINGVQITSWSTSTFIAQNEELFLTKSNDLEIGAYNNTEHFDGYMAEVVCIDGTALDETSFGEFDEDSPTIWKPKNVSGLTFGNNGFYLDFEDSANLGNDAKGGNDLTETNLDATDQSTDTPTNNFCTMNPLDNYFAGHTLSEGNLKVVSTASDWTGTLTATMGMSAGKWYWELFADTDSAVALYGIKSGVSHDDSNYLTETTSIGDIGYGIVTTSGNMGYPSGQSNSYGSALDADDVLMFALDMDNLKFYIGINGTWGNSGDPAGNSNGWTVTAPPSGFYFPGVTFNGSETIYFNFGSPPSGFTISSGNADGDGYGNFEYAPPSGFYALCTKNLGAYGG